jgi:hypothetical protein
VCFGIASFCVAVTRPALGRLGLGRSTPPICLLQLRDNLRGRSEAELFFHQVLSHLHDADPAYLTAGELSPEVSASAVLAKALRQAVPDEQGAGRGSGRPKPR